MKSTLRNAIALLLFATTLCNFVTKAQLPTTPPSHIVILIEENYAYHEIIGSSAAANAPHINALCADTNAAVFSQAYAIEHPSEPNYLDLFSGSNQGVTTDNVPTGYPFTTPNLGAELIAASKTFVTYSEDLPSVGYDGATYTAGGHNYARKHNPCTNWVGSGTNQFPATVNEPYTAFPSSGSYSSLPTVCYVVPNMTNDMHDGTYPSNITIGDTWMYTHLDTFRQWALANNTLYIITFDEDDDLSGNNIPLIMYGPMVKGGAYTEHVTLYSVLRTIEDMYDLPHAGNAATTAAITDCWKTSSRAGINNINDPSYSLKVMPNPANDCIHFTCNNPLNHSLNIAITDQLGRIMEKNTMTGTDLTINTTSLNQGMYFYKVTDENMLPVAEGKFIIMH